MRHARILKTRTKFEFRDDIYARLPPMNDSWLASGELLATGARDSRCGSHSLGRTTAPAQGARGPQALRLLVATAASRPASTQLAAVGRTARCGGKARGGGLLPVASTLSSVLRHLQESRYGVNLQLLQHKMISWRVSLRVPCSSAVCVCVCLPLCQWSVRLSCARNFVSLN